MKINQILKVGDKVNGTAQIKYVKFSGEEDFKIANVKILSVENEEQKELVGKHINVTGNIKDEDKDRFRFMGITKDNITYGMQLGLTLAYPDVDITSRKSLLAYLKRIVTKLQYEELVKTFDDPIEPLWNEDREALLQVKGIGKVRVETLVERFQHLKLELKYIREFAEYEIEPRVSKILTDYYAGNLKSLMFYLENDIYSLMSKVKLSFDDVDTIYLRNGGTADSDYRLNGIASALFYKKRDEGHTIVDMSDITRAISEYVYFDDPSGKVKDLLDRQEDKYVKITKYEYSLKTLYDAELLIAKEINRLQFTQKNFLAQGLNRIINEQEKINGFAYTDEQTQAVLKILASPVVTLEGPSGTGKTKSVKLLLEVLRANNYTFAQCALAGKASNVMANATGYEASTIHRLLGPNLQGLGYAHDAENKLPYDVIIVDEFSMVDVDLMSALVVAIKDGAKLVLVGDMGQLEPIGIQVMRPFVESGIIPAFKYTKIHRQAEKSAIITDSIGLRKGINPLGDGYITGKFTHGELQDLTYYVGDEDSKLLKGGFFRFRDLCKEGVSVMDIQIITQTKKTCYTFNKSCQALVNPPVQGETVMSKKINGYDFIFRKGTKVINTVNNYDTVTEDGAKLPVYNGSMGIVQRVREVGNKTEILIDFEGVGLVVMDSPKSLDYAYAVTVHKVQGSQFKHTIAVIANNQRMNTRQLLYTAMTRSQLTCDIYISSNSLNTCVNSNSMYTKKTNLCDMLKNFKNY